MKVTMKEKIVLLGKGNLIPENELAKHAYRAMKWNVKWKRGLNEEFFRKHMRETELIFPSVVDCQITRHCSKKSLSAGKKPR